MEDIPNIPTDSDEYMYSSPDYQSELMNFLSNSSAMRNTARGALKQTLFSAGGTLVGAVALGPVGGLVGGIMGSAIGYLNGDDYDGIIIEVTKLETERRNSLMREVFTSLKQAGATMEHLGTAHAFGAALHDYASQEHVRNNIWNACMTSLRS